MSPPRSAPMTCRSTSGFSSSLAIGEALAEWIIGDSAGNGAPAGMEALAPGRFGPLGDDELISRGVWQYAHHYDPTPG